VKAGDVLIRLEDAHEQAQTTQAQAELELATAQYNRLQSLLNKKAVSQQEVDEAKANLDVRAAQLKIAQTDLDMTLIKAPFNGALGAKTLSLGQYVTLGSPLLDIVDRTRLTLEYSVSERYLSQVALGQTVSLLTSAYPDDTFTGTVNFIAPSIDVATRTLKVEAMVDNSDNRLSPGLSVKLMHVLGYESNGLKIPEQSIMPTVEGYKIYLVQEGIANSATVEIISRVKGFVYISGPVTAGDIVVTSGQEKLRDGATVEVLEKSEV
ncbi:MAG TPA: efflux RND transporter periplasmic adaptor subunit, partial [Gammaproteobacteria bacterium]|nr:efflux RND transporter periplasmic adaptor subunit [Gammaproteobacteria bacterium]